MWVRPESVPDAWIYSHLLSLPRAGPWDSALTPYLWVTPKGFQLCPNNAAKKTVVRHQTPAQICHIVLNEKVSLNCTVVSVGLLYYNRQAQSFLLSSVLFASICILKGHHPASVPPPTPLSNSPAILLPCVRHSCLLALRTFYQFSILPVVGPTRLV